MIVVDEDSWSPDPTPEQWAAVMGPNVPYDRLGLQKGRAHLNREARIRQAAAKEVFIDSIYELLLVMAAAE